MSYLNKYRKRLNSSGNNHSDTIIQSTKKTVTNNFSNSLFSELVFIDGVEMEVIITQEKTSEDKKLLLKPDTKINIGAVVQINELNYLAMDFLGDGINEIYPTATLKLCNSTFPIQSGKTTVLLGYDKMNRPITDDVANTFQSPCIVETSYFFRGLSEQITLPNDRIMITLKYQESENVKMNEEFIMYDSKFKITFVDYSKVVNGKGIMVITGERVSK